MKKISASVELTTIKIRSLFVNLIFFKNKTSRDNYHFMDDRNIKMLYWDVTYNQTVLYSSLAGKESTKILGWIFQWFLVLN